MSLIPVKDHHGLYRDSVTGALVNKNKNDYESYMNTKETHQSEKQRLDQVENELGEIKSLLQALLNK